MKGSKLPFMSVFYEAPSFLTSRILELQFARHVRMIDMVPRRGPVYSRSRLLTARAR